MRFLHPEFLFALVLIAVPVIVHLFNFRRFKKVYFSNVALLKKVTLQTTGSRQIKRYGLLICRSLAVTFLVFAFAKPYIPEADGPEEIDNRIISVYVDNSYSMEAQTREGTLLEVAKSRAKEIASLYEVNDRFQLVTNDFEGLHQQVMTREQFNDAVDTVEVSSRSRTFREVLGRQRMLLKGAAGESSVTYFVSDFQNNLHDGRPVEGESSTRNFLVKLSAARRRNISIDSVWFLSPLHRQGSSETMVVRLRNNSDQEAGPIALKLQVGGNQKALSSVQLAARQVVHDTLTFSSQGWGWQEGNIAIVDNPFTFDDRYDFSYEVRESLPLLIINEGEINPYIDAVYRSDAFFSAKHVGAGELDYSGLGTYPMIVANGLTTVGEGLAQQLSEYVRRGGTLFLFPSESGELHGLGRLTSQLGIDQPLARIEDTTRVSRIEAGHALFADVFQSAPRNPDLPVANSYVRYSNLNKTSKRVILGFQNRDLFLAHYRVGAGQVFLSAVAAAEESSNFVRHSLFVPVMYQSAFMSLRHQPLYYTIGRDQQIELRSADAGSREGWRLRAADMEVIPDMRQTGAGMRLFISEQVTRPGIYELVRGDSLISKVAFNTDPSESDFSFLSDRKLQDIFRGGVFKIYNIADGGDETEIKGANYGAQLWKLCLILSLICLAAEILLLRYYGQTT